MAARPRIVRAVIDRDDPDDVSLDESGDTIDPGFDEATYLRAFPDIADAVRRGTLESGLAHYRLAGRVEGRLDKAEYLTLSQAESALATPQVALDTLTISEAGSTLITGWSDDRRDRLNEVDLETRADSRHTWTAFPRLLRADVQRTLDTSAEHKFGFLLVAAPAGGIGAPRIDARAANAPLFRFASGKESRLHRDPVVASDADLRDLALAALPTAAAGELDPEAIYGILDQHVGVQIAAINRLIVDRESTRRLVTRYGPENRRFRGSIVTVTRGDASGIVPRLAMTASGAGATDYEHIVIVTNPNQFDAAAKAARIAGATIGLTLTLIMQPGGDPAGFGEDVALDTARSDRLIFMDQNVIPRDPDWAFQHTALLESAPLTQTRLFGGMLYSPDGALSHRGYYFQHETSLLARANELPFEIGAIRLNRLASAAARPMAVAGPAAGVPAAFMSVDRRWFETLGGFTRHYARAAYEDIDFCLRSRKHGFPAWVHPLPMWHFERRGIARPEPSKGGAILNEWLFHRQWDETVRAELLGLNALAAP